MLSRFMLMLTLVLAMIAYFPGGTRSDSAMKPAVKFKEQVRRNLVALISLAVAVTSLGYNTWRNEASESNRNQRLIAIELLRNVGELHQVVLHRHWDMDEIDKGNPRTGWALVLAIHDLAVILEAPVSESAEALRTIWEQP